MTRFVAGTVALFLIAVTLWGLVVAVVPATALRWTSVVVTSGSMTPALEPGDLIVAQPAADDLTTGSVAVFHNDDGRGLVTHRIAATNPDGTYTTKGDANPQPDSTPVPTDHITGTGRLRIPLLGTPLLWLRTGNWAALLTLGVTLAALLRLARYALHPQHDPWVAASAVPATVDAQPAIRPWVATSVMVAAALTMLPITSVPGDPVVDDSPPAEAVVDFVTLEVTTR